MVEKLIAEKEMDIDLIQKARQELADLREQKAFIKSKTANIDKEIAYKEANIEYLYNKLNILEDKLVYHE